MIDNKNFNRIGYIDAIKGFAIILVVFGHCVSSIYLLRLIYMVHLPIFFFIGGYFLNTDSDIKSLICNKSKSLLYPYLTFGFLVIILLTIKSLFIGDFTAKMLLKRLFALFYGHHIWIHESNTNYIGALWFLPCLFCSEIIAALIIKAKRNSIKILLCTLFFAIGIIASLPSVGSRVRLPLAFDVSCVACFIVISGYLFRKYEETISKWYICVVLCAFGLIAGFSDYYLCNRFLFEFAYIDMLELRFGIMPLFLIATICLSAGIMIVVKTLYRYIKTIFIPFEGIGIISLIIMCTHLYIRDFLRPVISEFPASNFVLAVATTVVSVLLSIIIYKYAKPVFSYSSMIKSIKKR